MCVYIYIYIGIVRHIDKHINLFVVSELDVVSVYASLFLAAHGSSGSTLAHCLLYCSLLVDKSPLFEEEHPAHSSGRAPGLSIWG